MMMKNACPDYDADLMGMEMVPIVIGLTFQANHINIQLAKTSTKVTNAADSAMD